MRVPKSPRSMVYVSAALAFLLAALPLSGPRAEDALLTVTDSSFEPLILNARKPVLLVIETEWCGPCRWVLSHLSELAPRLHGKVALANLDADASSATAARLHITSVPTLMLYKGGTVVATRVGALTTENLAPWINQSMGARVVTPAPN